MLSTLAFPLIDLAVWPIKDGMGDQAVPAGEDDEAFDNVCR